LRPPPLVPPIHIESSPGFRVGLDVRGGIGMTAGSDARGAFASLGGLLRAHYQYYELGFFYDRSDDSGTGAGFTHLGGLAGAWLPYHNWVDFELAVGIGSRSYDDPDPRYGLSGYELSGLAASLILGVSDRARSDEKGARAGGRVGGQLVFTYDVTQHDQPWTLVDRDQSGEQTETHGTTHVGGFSIGLMLTLGLDYGDAP
jgi:hypothetical protein